MINIENLTKTYNYKKSNAFTALKELMKPMCINCQINSLQTYEMKKLVSSCRILRW